MLTTKQVEMNIEKIANWLKEQGLDALYLSSFDQSMSEYVPMQDCLRYYVSGFDGSMGEAFVTAQGQAQVFADGRYHLQLDQQAKASNLKAVKTPFGRSNLALMQEHLIELGVKKLGVVDQRTPVKIKDELSECFTVSAIAFEQVAQLLELKDEGQLAPLYSVSDQLGSVQDQLQRLKIGPESAYFLTALDDVSWLTQLRGFHTPYNSYFKGKALVTEQKIYLLTQADLPAEFQNSALEVLKVAGVDQWQSIIKKHQIKTIKADFDYLNLQDYQMLQQLVGEKQLVDCRQVANIKAHKTNQEIRNLQENYQLAAECLFEVINWFKKSNETGELISEKQLAIKTEEVYRSRGALSLSFNVISGFSENAAIIHYSDPSEKRVVQKNDLVLLDSGAHFPSGLATDCTRTFLPFEKVKCDATFLKKYRYYYTLVLQGQIRAESSVFREGTLGCSFDQMARSALNRAGLDYQHGTGHGVGVCVHERGANLSSRSLLAVKEGQVLSIEPGVYLANELGIRLENVVVVKRHHRHPEFLYFEPLIYLPWEIDLIDESILSQEELTYLKDYHAECKKRGFEF